MSNPPIPSGLCLACAQVRSGPPRVYLWGPEGQQHLETTCLWYSVNERCGAQAADFSQLCSPALPEANLSMKLNSLEDVIVTIEGVSLGFLHIADSC